MNDSSTYLIAHKPLQHWLQEVLQKAGADQASATAVSDAVMHASRLGVDSHGVRLVPHYVQASQGGRINGRPKLQFEQRTPAVGYLDADNGFGHLAGYRAIEHGIEMAATLGIAAISVGNSSHFGAAGAYTCAAARRGHLALAVCNADAIVLCHGGVDAFHGTNPISFAAPVPDQNPYLLDMATSSIPWNRVLQYRAIARTLPAEVAADRNGQPVQDASQAATLFPLGGGEYGYKGAGLAGFAEILSSALTGMAFSLQLLPMTGPDFSTPRRLGQWFLVLRPDAFVSQSAYQQCISAYLKTLREQASQPDTQVMAPGDREWAVAAEREAKGIPLDSAVYAGLRQLADRFGVALPALSAE